jgi:glycosyltransferase involved in cell wall biosynthesis
MNKSNKNSLNILAYVPLEFEISDSCTKGGGGWLRFYKIYTISKREDVNYNLLHFNSIKDIQLICIPALLISMIKTLIQTSIIVKLKDIHLILCPIEDSWALILAFISSTITRRKFVAFIDSIPLFGQADVPPFHNIDEKLSYKELFKVMKVMGRSRIRILLRTFMWYITFKVLRSPKVHIMCLSKFTADELNKLRIKPAVEIFPGNGIDYKVISLIPPKTKKYDAIFAAGSLLPQKGIFEVVNIWKNVVREKPYAKLAIVGRIPPENLSILKELRIMIHSLNLDQNVIVACDLLKGVNQSELWKEMKGSKIFIYPSRKDVWPLIVGEALACGLPVIAYNLPGNRDAYGECSAIFLMRVGDIQGTGKMAVKILNNNSLYEELSLKAQQYARKQDWNHVIRLEKKAYLIILNS